MCDLFYVIQFFTEQQELINQPVIVSSSFISIDSKSQKFFAQYMPSPIEGEKIRELNRYVQEMLLPPAAWPKTDKFRVIDSAGKW